MKKTIYPLFALLALFSCTSQSLEDIRPDCSSNPVVISINTEKSDCGLNNGSVVVTVTGGVAPYIFTIGDGDQADGSFTNLAPGTFSVIVTDANSCSETMAFTIENVGGTTATATSTSSGCGFNQATITVVAANGVAPYSYRINDGPLQFDNVFNSVGAGLQRIIVSDANGCEFTLDHPVLSGTSYAQQVEPIIMNNCAVTGCHSGSQQPNFSIFANVQNNAENIKIRTQNGSMPPGGRTLTQEQINLIACWIDDGAQDN